MDRDVMIATLQDLIGTLEGVLAELDILSISLEQSSQWENHDKVQRVVYMVKKLIGDRNGIQSPPVDRNVLQK